jgi:peptidoglycan/LPS O-acetylase OafA/YrhL
MKQSPNLDLLRAVAVLCVFVDHLWVASSTWPHPGSLGRFGVVIFFVHTSFVLMCSLQRLEGSGLSENWRLTAVFWIRRFFRIYPLAVFCVLTMAVFRIPPGARKDFSWVGIGGFFSNLGLTQNLTYSRYVLDPLWSLPLEVQMYAMLPFAYFVVRSGSKYRAYVLWVLSVVLALTLPRAVGRLSVFTYAPCFTSGIIAFDQSRRAKWKFPAWTWPLAILIIITLFGPLDNINLPDKKYRAWALSLILGLVVSHVRESAWPVVHKFTHWIAEQSYGIYLSHVAIFWVAINVMASQPVWARVLVLVVGSVGVPFVLYNFLESPLIGAGARLANRLRGEGPPIALKQPVVEHPVIQPLQAELKATAD